MCIGLGITQSNIFIVQIFKKFKSSLQQKEYNNADKYLIQCHIISSTFKALSSWKC